MGSSRAIDPVTLASIYARQWNEDEDAPVCVWCRLVCDLPTNKPGRGTGGADATIDHIDGTYGRGSNREDNTVIAHRRCNSARAVAQSITDETRRNESWEAYLNKQNTNTKEANRRLAAVLRRPLARTSDLVRRLIEKLGLGRRIEYQAEKNARAAAVAGAMDVAGMSRSEERGKTTEQRYALAKQHGFLRGKNGEAEVTREGHAAIKKHVRAKEQYAKHNRNEDFGF